MKIVKKCPYCKSINELNATQCSSCWTSLEDIETEEYNDEKKIKGTKSSKLNFSSILINLIRVGISSFILYQVVLVIVFILVFAGVIGGH